MSSPSTSTGDGSTPTPERRQYNSPLRRQQLAETRARILAAGSALVHEFPTWDWRDLTFRAVADEAGVSERTVYRHFASEQELHRAVMYRLEEEAGVKYEGLRLENLAKITERVFARLPSFAVPSSHMEPPFAEEDRRRRDALLAAVSELATNWTAAECDMAAGMLDVIWATQSYERLTTAWNLEPQGATGAVTWVLDLLVAAIRDGSRPTSAKTSSRGRSRATKAVTDDAAPPRSDNKKR
jgi:AcrR family transcriptional regulator